MNHELINYQNDKFQVHVSNLGRILDHLGENVKFVGKDIYRSVDNLSLKIEKFSESSDRQSNKMYWLTWVLAVASLLNVVVMIFQNYITKLLGL